MPDNRLLVKGEMVISLTIIAPDKRQLKHRIGLLIIRFGAWLCRIPFTVQADLNIDKRMGVE